MTSSRAAPRRSNQQRTAEMRARLLEATIACFIELGYARTTTTEIAERAGVSRGAMLHHYPTKEELVLAAVEQLFSRRKEEFLAAFARVPKSADRPAAALELLWKIVGGETFYAWLELAVAGRSDDKLGRRVRELGVRIGLEVDKTFRELFPAPATANAFFDVAPRFAFAVLQGLALDRLLLPERAIKAEQVVTLLKQLSAFAFTNGAQP